MLIQTLGNGAIAALQKIWERDLNLTFSDEDWNGIFKNIKEFQGMQEYALFNLKLCIVFIGLPPDYLD